MVLVMYLSNLKLWNFRKFGGDGIDELNLQEPHVEINFTKGVNLLVGENDSGKSAIIDAIKLILKTHSVEWIKLEDGDFFKNSNRLRIECIFEDFSDQEAKNFVEWLGTKDVLNEDGTSKTVPFLRLIMDAKRTADKILPCDVKAGVDDEGSVISAEAREYLKVTYLRPLRDAKSELIAKKNSRLSQILYSHPVFKDKENHELVKILIGANTQIKGYFENEAEKDKNGFPILSTLKTYLASFLKKNTPQDTKFHIDDPKLKNILEILKLTLQDELSGLGTYNLLFIAAELLHLRKDNYNGLKLGLIEEVEAHLHPQAQLRVMAALENESDKDGVQLILTTHSPNLASKAHVENIILCYGQNVFPLRKEYSELKDADYNFLERFLDVTKSNLFFAQGLLLVEGDAENILIPSIAKLIGKNLTEYGVSIVNVGGRIFLRYSRIFQRKPGLSEIGLPVSVVTDLDIKPEDEAAKKTEETTKIEQKYSGQSVKTFVSPHQTLEYCLALSANLKELLFNAIKAAGEEMENDGYSGKKISGDWSTFSAGVEETELAKKIYKLLTKEGKAISKSITAQFLSKFLEEKSSDQDFVKKLKDDQQIKYIVDAINYVTPDNN